MVDTDRVDKAIEAVRSSLFQVESMPEAGMDDAERRSYYTTKAVAEGLVAVAEALVLQAEAS
jgi:hypothetical protein